MLHLKRYAFKNLFLWNLEEKDSLDHRCDNDNNHITFKLWSQLCIFDHFLRNYYADVVMNDPAPSYNILYKSELKQKFQNINPFAYLLLCSQNQAWLAFPYVHSVDVLTLLAHHLSTGVNLWTRNG